MLRVLLVLAVVLLTPKVALACECTVPVGPIIRAGGTGVVGTGRVVNIRFGDFSRSPSADIEITEGFLNAKSGTRITVYNAAGNCAYPFREGENYLVVTDFVEKPDSFWSAPAGSQAASLCGRTKVLNSPEGKRMLATIRLEMRRLRR